MFSLNYESDYDNRVSLQCTSKARWSEVIALLISLLLNQWEATANRLPYLNTVPSLLQRGYRCTIGIGLILEFGSSLRLLIALLLIAFHYAICPPSR